MDVANYVVQHFIEKNHPIPNLLLLKILYYLQADSLRKDDIPLFKEPIEKWGYGPVVPEVYSNFKTYGSTPIISTIKYAKIDDNGLWKMINPVNRKLEQQDILKIDALADEIFDNFGNKPFELVKQTHREKMWREDESKIRNGSLHIPYSNEEIKDYFRSKDNWPWKN